jgi:uncharacterized protein (DUF1800 family)
MGKIHRREFFEELIAAEVENAPAQPREDQLFKKYANKEVPKAANKTTSGLNQYTGPWTHAEMIHLLRRTTFGVKYSDVLALEFMTMDQAVDQLLNVSTTPPTPPLNNYQNTYADPTGIPFGQPWVSSGYGDNTVNSHRLYSLKSWWFSQIVDQPISILEKMVLFWHNHFAIETLLIGDARMSYKYNALLRANALGNFKTLTRQVTTDPAMLRYLNGYLNTKTAPDENYARELQELFTISKDFPTIYDEDDVKAAAKVLTGWRVNSTSATSFFDSSKHDTGTKVFSSFYGNKVIYGKTGSAGANETDELIDMLFNKLETAIHICRKLYRYFVYYVIDTNTHYNVIVPLAQTLVFANFDIKPILSTLLKSEHFFDVNNRDCYIRTPTDFLAGSFRTFGITFPGGFSIDKQYAVWNYLRSYGSILNQELGDPPNVAGWPAYYQVPEFYEVWINSTTLPRRMSYMDMMLASGFSAGTGTAFKIDVVNFAKQYPNAGDPNMLMDYCVELLLGIGLSSTKKNDIKTATLLSGQTSDYYWTSAWAAYISNPNATNTNIVKTRLTGMLTELTHLAEHHLC